MADEKATKAPPYISYLTFKNFLDWLQEMETIPSQFDRSFWGHKFSGSSGAQLMTGLRFLGLLDGDQPTERLELLARAKEPERKQLLASLLRDVYGTALVDGLPKMTPKMLNDQIAGLGTTDGTHRKAMSFFVNAAKAADLPMPSSIAKQARNKPGTRRSPRAKTAPPNGTVPEKVESPEKAALPHGLHDAVHTILSDLPKVGPTWDEATKKRWMATFSAVLDYAYPVKGGGPGD